MESKKYQLILYKETLAVKNALLNIKKIDNKSNKPILRLENLKTSFKTPFNGYLRITGEYCNVYFDDNSFIPADNFSKNFYFEKGTIITISNKLNVTSIIYESV